MTAGEKRDLILEKVGSLDEKAGSLEERVSNLEADLREVQKRVTSIDLLLENKFVLILSMLPKAILICPET